MSESNFIEMMARLGVKRLGDDQPAKKASPTAWPGQIRAQEPQAEEADQFLQAMASMAVIPDKDETPLPTEIVRLKERRKARLDDSLDLHGMGLDDALQLLAGFIANAFAHNLGTVIVITGKGKHSKGGVGVLRPAVERWILQQGKRFIRSYAEAPRAFGGKGAFIVHLRSS